MKKYQGSPIENFYNTSVENIYETAHQVFFTKLYTRKQSSKNYLSAFRQLVRLEKKLIGLRFVFMEDISGFFRNKVCVPKTEINQNVRVLFDVILVPASGKSEISRKLQICLCFYEATIVLTTPSPPHKINATNRVCKIMKNIHLRTMLSFINDILSNTKQCRYSWNAKYYLLTDTQVQTITSDSLNDLGTLRPIYLELCTCLR